MQIADFRGFLDFRVLFGLVLCQILGQDIVLTVATTKYNTSEIFDIP